MRKASIFAVLLAAGAAFASRSAAAQEKAETKSPGKTMRTASAVLDNPADMKWVDAPPIFPPGAKMSVIQGDPGKATLYTVRVKVGDGYKIPAHWHPTTENVTVVSGTFHIGMVHGMGPFKLTYVNPEDLPAAARSGKK